MNNLNQYRHWYLYCKGWYKKTDIIEDLKVIQSHWCGIEKVHLTEYDILSVMMTIVHKHIHSKNDFFRFIDNSLKGNVRFVGGSENDDQIRRMILSAKSIIGMAKKEDIDGELGEPDFNILPKRENF